MPRRKKSTKPERQPEGTESEAREAEIDRDIADDFQERQALNAAGSRELADSLREHTALSPEDSAGDVDAAWDLARESGEEAFTGHAPTPDQDRVDDLGAAAGLTYTDDEPLHYSKVSRRDNQRWELDPRSGQEEQAMEEPRTEEDEDDDADNAPLRFWDLADDLDAEVDEDDEEDDDKDEGDEVEDDDEDLLSEAEAELEDEDEAEEAGGDNDFDDESLDDELDEDLDDELDEDDDDDDD